MTKRVGEWFASMAADGRGFILWQQTPTGPVRAGLIYSEPTASELVERMNEASLAHIKARLGPLFKTAFGDLAESVLNEVLKTIEKGGS
jgi:hypothetical protein